MIAGVMGYAVVDITREVFMVGMELILVADLDVKQLKISVE